MEAVLLCGVPSSGKSTLYLSRFADTHVRINRDLFQTPQREGRFLDLCLDQRQPFVVDQVNATPDDRSPYIGAARRGGFRAIAMLVDTPVREAVAYNAARPMRFQAPVETILETQRDLVRPLIAEGFDEIWHAWPDGGGGFHVERKEIAPEQPPAEEPRFHRDPTRAS